MYKAPTRTNKIVKLRDKGLIYKDIGKRFNITGTRVRDIYTKYKKRLLLQSGWGSLEIREINALKKAGYFSLIEVKDNINTVKIRGIGEGTIKKINYLLKQI